MKPMTPFFVIAILLVSCSLSTPPPIEIDAINTAAFEAVGTAISAAQTMTASVPTGTPIPDADTTPSPFPASIEALLQDKCDKPWQKENAYFNIRSHGLVEKYGNKGCRLPIFSPNETHLAYVTLDRQGNQNVYLDSVKILETD